MKNENLDVDNLTGRNHEGAHANTPVRLLTASSVMKDTIIGPNGEKLGYIKDIMLNLENGTIEYIVMESGGFLGLGGKFFALPLRVLRLDTEEHAFSLDLDKDILKAAPGFDKDHWPGTNAHEYESANAYWGGFMGPNTGAEPY